MTLSPPVFKAIALFTPGGDVIYSINTNKRRRWHLDLCVALQEILGLPEPPHFLVPAYTATVDRWLDPKTNTLHTAAELHPAVKDYQEFLNVLFELPAQQWTLLPGEVGQGDPLTIATYRDRLPELWESHELVMSLEDYHRQQKRHVVEQTFELRLFLAGNNYVQRRILSQVHQLLETGLGCPYSLKVIDIIQQPELAEADQVIASPTLVRIHPKPVRRIVGDFRDVERVLQVLLTY
ncbi:MAG: circadian clock KaiB family protein [Cyanobacteria bacterium P01_H01_bin.15]